jgi:ATP-dependent HslUV protease subunit HslV
MTTIVYRDGELAADTGMTAGGSMVGHVTKIGRNAKGDLAGAAGDASYNFAFIAWFVVGEQGSAPEAKEDDKAFDRGVIFRRDGRIEVFEPRGRFECSAPYYALGSGRPEALGALFMGATAEQAVRAAMAHDANTFGDVDVLAHEMQRAVAA